MSLLRQYDDKHLRVTVAVSSMNLWLADFGASMINLFAASLTHRFGQAKSQDVQLFSSIGSLLPKMRKEAVEHALQSDSAYLLFVDSDHKFPKNALHRLLSADKAVVAVNCVTKTIPTNPTARLKSPDVVWGEPLDSIGAKGLQKVWRVGTGMMLIHRSVLEKIGSNVFSMFWREDVQTYQGEDWSMCEAMENAGFDIWIDHDLSREVTHIGYLHYTHEMSVAAYANHMKGAR